MKSNIAKNIKSIIKEKGYKQYVIGNRAGYTDKQFNDIIPIANALDCEPADLLK